MEIRAAAQEQATHDDGCEALVGHAVRGVVQEIRVAKSNNSALVARLGKRA